ncbi:MAG: sugar ABC transporter permease [Candidatus Poribacteria bacterium]|nr:sugar ABC transporter permease [Candidatus Poribacteria bacterium]
MRESFDTSSRPQMTVWQKRLDRWLPGVLLAPTGLLLFGLFIFPLLWSLGLSFYDYAASRNRPPVFIGVDNYAALLSDAAIWQRFATTGAFVIGSVGLQFVVGVGLAFLLYREFWGRKVVLSLLLVPMMMAPVAAGAFFRFIYDPSFGVIGFITNALFGVTISWLEKPFPAMVAVILTDTWMWSPFVMLLVLSGLLAVPKHLLEMAQIDRAGWWLTLRNIVFPQIKPLLMLAVLLRTMEAFKLFDTIWIMTQGGPGTATETLSISLYRVGFQYYKTGRASALAYLMLIVVIVLSNFYLRVAMRQTSTNGGNESV